MFFEAAAGPVLGSIGKGLVDSLFGGDDDEGAKIADSNRIWQTEMARIEYERQKEFAQMGLRWKSADAAAAGIHPVAALGGIGSTYSPTTVMPAGDGGYSGRGSRTAAALNSSIDAITAGMGQNTARAQMATATEFERQMQALQLENINLQNAKIQSEIHANYHSINSGAGMGPPMPGMVGAPVAPVGAIDVQGAPQVSHAPGDPSRTASRQPFSQRFNIGGGGHIDLPSQAAAESLESMGPLMAPAVLGISALRKAWHGPETTLPEAPAGYRWEWDPMVQTYKLLSNPRQGRSGSAFRPGRGNSNWR